MMARTVSFNFVKVDLQGNYVSYFVLEAYYRAGITSKQY